MSIKMNIIDGVKCFTTSNYHTTSSDSIVRAVVCKMIEGKVFSMEKNLVRTVIEEFGIESVEDVSEMKEEIIERYNELWVEANNISYEESCENDFETEY